MPAARVASFAMAAMQLSDTVACELVDDDADCTVSVERIAAEDVCYAPMNEDATMRVLCGVGIVPQGVLKMSSRMERMVEYSRNVGVIRTEETGVKVTMTSRSGIESQLDHAEQSLAGLAALVGGTVTHRNRYPGWDFAPVSRVRRAYIEAFHAQFGYEPQVLAIHAGLESGYLKKNLPDMDIIAVGPDMKNLHSPDERLNLPSVERVWRVLLHLLAHWE
jgi:dipeptidase D